VPIFVETFDEATARARLVDALLAYDEPFGDSSSLPTYLLSHHVAHRYKVALGGDGGDEVFAGYKRYMILQFRSLIGGSARLRDWTGRALSLLPMDYERNATWNRWAKRVRLVAGGLDGDSAHAYVQLAQFAPLARTAKLMRSPVSSTRFEDAVRTRFERARGTELQKFLANDLAGELCNDILVKVDRASMACSLEARVPFLDHRVVEFGVGLPEAFTSGPRSQPFVGKRVLRALHERRFGPALASRKKQGFVIPIRQWLTGPYANACERLFDKQRLDRFGILSSDALSNGAFQRWLNGPAPEIAWHAFALAAWCEATLGDGPDSLRQLLEPSLEAQRPSWSSPRAAGASR
jgi:asparagine synthase (glutamine-hydrolysing)